MHIVFRYNFWLDVPAFILLDRGDIGKRVLFLFFFLNLTFGSKGVSMRITSATHRTAERYLLLCLPICDGGLEWCLPKHELFGG
jgi:hypothetical protein